MDLVEKEESEFDVMIDVQTKKKGEVTWPGKKNAKVVADATVGFGKPADVSQYNFAKVADKDEQGNLIKNPDGSIRMVASQPATIWGGMVKPPKPGADSLEIRTWSGEVYPSWANNQSHAEHNFVDWAREHMKIQLITSIELTVKGHWPCKNCASNLKWLANEIQSDNGAAKPELNLVVEKATNWENEWSSGEECEAALDPWHVSGLGNGAPVEIAKT